ncbi:ATP-dependent RNA helicase HrpA [Nakamurella silvestris]|nr:ATP-dependent RNA helicase HrpA [Nakamurella silvestris]
MARAGTLNEADADRLRRRLSGVRRIADPEVAATMLDRIAAQIDGQESRAAQREAARPTITYPEELPVSARVDDLKAAIQANQVIIVAGETGSGKSTQLPKICLDLGRGVNGLIGHTQPRRIAARALAERISEETGTELGQAIGYTIRFGDHTGPQTMVKLMTDGILLAEIVRDRLLTKYDTIIIDEAHERSLNIDFLLGYLAQLLPRRPDLKIIITSATIDPERFSKHFAGAPIVEVSGRTFPVEIWYRPIEGEPTDPDDDDASGAPRSADRDPIQAICDAVDELGMVGDGDILVFLSGEREIRDTAEVLRGHLADARPATEVLPLYGRLSSAEQHQVFSAHSGRRIVLATNVAETSLTVPGIRYVIDPGTARISRYSLRTKVQRLPIEPISQASAGQRAGRCGRVADGVCIRLYSEEDFLARPEFTDPEILRTSLASVILQMASLDLGDVNSFPFLDPPDPRQVGDGLTLLSELGALQRDSTAGGVRLTPIGTRLAALPLDPQLARMIIEADTLGCSEEIIVIAAALAIQDVREFPLEEREKATAFHSRFADHGSDFLSIIRLWAYLRDQGKALSGSAFRRMCRTEYLHYLRIREWQDLVSQLRQIAKGMGIDTHSSAATVSVTVEAAPVERGQQRPDGRAHVAKRKGIRRDGAAITKPTDVVEMAGAGDTTITLDSKQIHSALLSGLISHIGLRDEVKKDYQGTRGARFSIWPGSRLAKSSPRLVMAAELVETSRLWARTVAKIEPEWVEAVGGDLLKRQYSEPRWSARQGAVVATERATLLGVTIFDGRTVQYSRIDPELSRELFIRHALVEGEWHTRHAFFAHNNELLEQITEREDRARRRDIAIDDETLFSLYDSRIGAEAVSARHFDTWYKKIQRTEPGLLTFTEADLVAAGAKDVAATDFPDQLNSGGVDLPVSYVFEPGREDDGVTVTIPLTVLQRVAPASFAAGVPGIRQDLAVALIRSLPKTLRRAFVPVPDFAKAALQHAEQDRAARKQPNPEPLAAELAAALTALTGVVVEASDFDMDKVPAHLRITFQVVDSDGTPVASGKDLAGIQKGLRSDTRTAVAKVSGGLERTGLTTFPAEGVSRYIDTALEASGSQTHTVRGYPALVDEGASVGVRVFALEADQTRAMRAGVRRLLVLGIRSPLGFLKYALPKPVMLNLTSSPYGTFAEFVADATEAAVEGLLDWAGGVPWTAKEFDSVRTRMAPHVDKAVADVLTAVDAVLHTANQVAAVVPTLTGSTLAFSVIDVKTQLQWLLPRGFIMATTAAGLTDLNRHLQALLTRVGRVPTDPERDRARMGEILPHEERFRQVLAAIGPERQSDPEVRQARTLLAEWRVGLFAQPMKTAVPVSEKRVTAALDQIQV